MASGAIFGYPDCRLPRLDDSDDLTPRSSKLFKLCAGDKAPVVRDTLMSCRIRMQKARRLALSQANQVAPINSRLVTGQSIVALLGIGIASFGRNLPVDGHRAKHPQVEMRARMAPDERANGLELDVLEEALQASIVRVDLGGTWEGGGQLGPD